MKSKVFSNTFSAAFQVNRAYILQMIFLQIKIITYYQGQISDCKIIHNLLLNTGNV
jgi:hypothetical protein